ncbi:MAG: DUF2868 domain-containing protein [Phycisphaerales bacterium JB063]
MATPPNTHVSPVELIALAARLNHDEQRPRGELVTRDRALSAKLASLDGGDALDDAARLRWWLEHAEDAEADAVSDQVHSAMSLAGFGLVLLGLLMGSGVALGVFVFDGERPVNVVAALGVFVFLQAATLVLAVLAVLPAGWTVWLPGFSSVQEALRRLSPGRLSFLIARLMPQGMREALAASIGRAGAHRRVYGRVQLWAVVRWSQLFAVAFNVAAAGVFVSMVVFTDLLFVWSTTLDIEPDSFHALTSAVSLPWVFVAEAVPTLELVHATRFQRGTGDLPSRVGGSWWSFLLLSMLVYGLLPRLVALVWAQVALGRASRHALVATPGATAVLHRLRGGAAAQDTAEEVDCAAGSAWPEAGVGTHPVVVDWSRAAGTVGRARQVLGLEVDDILPAGGARTMDEDTAAVEQVGTLVVPGGGGPPRGVVVLVKLWEPPMLEVLSFLKALRSSVGDAVPVRVCAVSHDASGRLVSDDAEHLAQWRRRVQTLGDPWLTVAMSEEGAGDDG